MKKKLLLFLLAWCAICATYAQTITGKVTDENGQTLPGVSVSIRQTNRGSTTNALGEYSISVNDANTAVLAFSFIGYQSQDIKVSGRSIVNVQLAPAQSKLDEVVVTALGITRQSRSLGYSTQKVGVDEMTEARDVNITNLLAGKVAGLQLTTTGQPGSSTRIVLRGENSLTGNNQPLWVVDGVPISNDMGDSRGDNLDYGNGAADLNPDDIASIEVLKGPNAAALYGSRAANGAILVTTKKGKVGDKNLGVSVNQNTMIYTITEFPAYQNVYGEGRNSRLVADVNLIVPGTGAVNMGSYSPSWGAPMLGQPYNTYGGQPSNGYYPQPGNVKALYKNSITNISNISVSKADDVSAFRASYTYTRGNDVLENQNLSAKHNVNLSGSRKLGKLITLDTRILYTYEKVKNRTYRNLDPSSPMATYVYLPRSVDLSGMIPWKDAAGNAIQYGQLTDTENPYWSIYENQNEDAHNRLIGGLTATVRLSSWLNFRGQITGDMNFANAYQYKELGGRRTPNGYYGNSMQNVQNWNYEGLLMANRQLSPDFKLAANLGTNLASNNALSRTASINALLNHNMPSISNTRAVPVTNESLVRSRVQSIYGSATLGFRNLLFMDVTGRNDWSSTLPKGNNSFFYPSVSGSFIFTELLKDQRILSYGKLRASWAQVGNSAPAYFLQNTYTTPGTGVLFLGNPILFYGTQLKNADLKPEQTVSREVGIELTFLDRLNLSATVYKSNSTNQIIQAQTPPETGFTTRVVNAGEMTNKGIEISVDGAVLRKKNFSWNVFANWSMNRNKVLSLVPGVDRLQLGQNLGVTVNAQVGQPYGLLLGNAPYMVGDTVLVNPTNGRLIIEANQSLGSYRPDWLGSIGSNFKYGRFDLSFLLTTKWGGRVYSASYGRANFAGTTIASLEGRDDYFFSSVILGENGNERQGIGQTVGTTVTPYIDAARPKGRQYKNSYFSLTDPVTGAIIYDKNGRRIPGKPNNIWAEPQLLAGDYVLNNTPDITFDATSVKLTELIFGYTLPPQVLGRTGIKSARLALTGRNLWTIYKKTPQGIDPDAANSTGNAQGIEAGGSFPFAQFGFDLKLSF